MLGLDARAARVTWTVALVLLSMAVLYLLRGILLVLVVALLFAYLLYPLMDFISRRFPSKTRTPALAITFLIVIAILAGLGSFVGSVVVQQAASLAQGAPAFVHRMQQPAPVEPGGVRSLRQQAGALLQNQVSQHYDEIVGFIPRITVRVLSASANLIYIVIVPIISFFILRDGREIRDGLLLMLDHRRAAAREMLADIHELLLQYMRALLLLCCSTFVVFTVVLSLMRVPYAVLLATVAFPLEFVPLIGPLVAAIIVIAVSVASGFGNLLMVIIFLIVFRVFQDYVLSPALMSRGVELHPLLVILGVLAGAEIGGVAGVFLSIPVLALLRLLYLRVRGVPAARGNSPTQATHAA